MTWTIYDYVDRRGRNAIKPWELGQDKRQLAKLNQKLDMIEITGPDLCPAVFTTPKGQIRKIKVQGNPKLRPLICIGPIQGEEAITILVGTNEVQSRLDVEDAYEIANNRRSEVLIDPVNRRCQHERIPPRPNDS